MLTLWQIIFYIILAILAILIFRLILHIIFLFLSNRKNRTLQLRVAEDYDFIEAWKAEPDDNNRDSDD